VYDAFLAWHQGDAPKARHQLETLREEANVLETGLRSAIFTRMGLNFLALGRPADARNILELARPTSEAHLLRAAIAFAVNDLPTAHRETLVARVAELPASATDRTQSNLWTLAIWLLCRSGDTSAAEQLLATLDAMARKREAPVGPAAADLLGGELSLARGAVEDSIKRLSSVKWEILVDGPMFRATETLADALARKGDLTAAAATLAQVSALKHRGAYDFAYWWMRCQLRLAEIYLQLGRTSDATTIARELEGMLSEAESDFPLLERVQAVLYAH
jgi:ATP/maltotriose-dependent transcriptional regulator MalT